MSPIIEGRLTNRFFMKEAKLTTFLNPLFTQRRRTQKIDVKIKKIEKLTIQLFASMLHPSPLDLCETKSNLYLRIWYIKPQKAVLAQNQNRSYNAGKYQKMKLFGISRKSLILDVLLGSEYSWCDYAFMKINPISKSYRFSK